MLPLRRMNAPLPHDAVVPDQNSASTKKEQVAQMFDGIAPRYDLLNRLLSVRIDLHWRKDALRELVPLAPKKILDVATGTADLALLAQQILRPDSIVGIDISAKMLAVGKEKIGKADLSDRIQLETGDAEAINHPDQSFDLVMVAYGIRNFQNLSGGLKEMLRVLRPGGKLLILEFSRPRNPLWRGLYQFYMKRYVPTMASLLGQDKKAYAYLDESARLFPEREDMLQILKEAGYSDCQYKTYTGGICSRYLATRPL
jgi:demethylmenaquinone methyltransferase/2-methoxy-6-polyprenyl-1,4-benzoquinol methylase